MGTLAELRARGLSFGQRMTLWYGLTVGLLSFGLASFLYYRLERDLTRHYAQVLRSYAGDLGAMVGEYAGDNGELSKAIESEIASYAPIHLLYRVRTLDGEVEFESSGWDGLAFPNAFDASGQALAVDEFRFPHHHTLFLSVAHVVDTEAGPREVQAAISTRPALKTLRNYRQNALLIFLPIMALAIYGGAYLTRKSLRPTVDMAQRAEQITVRHLDRRLPLTGTGDELDQLASALNAMIDRLEEAYVRIESFASELAHELKTPLTQLILETESALVSRKSREEIATLLVHHASRYREMNALIRDLLDLLRVGTPGSRAEKTPVDIGDLVRDVADSFEVLAAERSIGVRCDGLEHSATVHADRSALRRALANLLDNAVRHAREDTDIVVALSRQESELSISVSDRGVGIPEAEVGRVFDRFFRGSRARGRGSGLGLSIVSKVAEEHGGRVNVRSEVGEGSTFSISLPLADVDDGHDASMPSM